MKKAIGLVICICICVLYASNIRAEEESLEVNITQENGESVLVKSGHPFYTALPVIFSIPCETGDNYYSISIDEGASFGAYVKAESGSVKLYPDDKTAPDGRWQIRFANVSEGTERDSEIYRICFDIVPPVIEIDESGKIRISDANGIIRYTVKIGDKTVDEVIFDDSLSVTEHETELLSVKEAEYGDTVRVICEDIAGNCTEVSYEYLIDEGSPELVTEGVTDGDRLHNPARIRACATDKESNCYVNYMCERISEDKVITTSEYNLAPNTDISFEEDGRYTVVLYASDDAGNESVRQNLKFIIDRTAPGIQIGGICEGVDITSELKIPIEVKDELYEDTEVNIKLTKILLGNMQNIPIGSYKLNATCDERIVDINSDGEYILEVGATDGVGNTTDKSCRFRIDKTAPEITVSGIREGEITNEKSMLRFSAGEYFYDSTIMSAILEKKESRGYVTVSSTDHVMRAPRDDVDIAVDSEGEYRLTCTAADRSGNKARKEVAFTVDYTPPVISQISGFDGKFLRSFSLAKKISDYVSDASPYSAKAYLNDTDFQKGDVVIEEGKYLLTVIAEDAASNASEETVSFIVDHTAPQVVLSGFDKNGNIKKGSIIKVSLLEEGDSLTQVRFNGRNILIGDDNTATIAVNEYGKYNLEVRAEDQAGNITDTQIGTECYMYGGVFNGYSVDEKTISASAPGDDFDVRGLLIGLASVLSGTFGLTYRTYLSGK